MLQLSATVKSPKRIEGHFDHERLNNERKNMEHSLIIDLTLHSLLSSLLRIITKLIRSLPTKKTQFFQKNNGAHVSDDFII